MSDLARARCGCCHTVIALLSVPARAHAGLAPFVRVSPVPQCGRIVRPWSGDPTDNAISAWTLEGEAVLLVPGLEGEEAYLDHDAVCLTRRPRTEPATRFLAESLLPPTTGCRGCHRLVAWLTTPAGKRTPVDPEPHRGIVLGRGVAARAQDAAAVVRGYRTNGEAVRILEISTAAVDLPEGAEIATVYVSHWATCPEAHQFRKSPAASAAKGA